jgi:deazaflavin-dependent oxidoreductase (nitroreductase family)
MVAITACLPAGDRSSSLRRPSWGIASKAGAPTNPAWYHNLLTTPTASVELPNESFPVHTRITEGPERDRLFQKVAEHFPIYADYQRKTGRHIPVIVLEPVVG